DNLGLKMPLRSLRWLLAALLLVKLCPAQLPGYYATVNRVTWVVGNIDKVRAAWETLGLSDIEEYPNIQLVGQYRGKPVTVYAWQITGHLGNLTVDMIQPAEAQENAYTSFLGRHGDGILAIVHEVSSQQALEKEVRSEEHTSELQSRGHLVCRLLLEKKKKKAINITHNHSQTNDTITIGILRVHVDKPFFTMTRSHILRFIFFTRHLYRLMCLSIDYH